MAYQNGTTHYNLPQTVGTDKRDWSDTNKAFADVDAALYNAAESSTNNKTAIDQLQIDVAANTQQIDTNTDNIATNAANIGTNTGDITKLKTDLQTAQTDLHAEIVDVRNDAEDMITAYNEPNAVSTHRYVGGQYFIYNDVLYMATTLIDEGDTIVPNTNCTATNVTSELIGIKYSSKYATNEMITAHNETSLDASTDYAVGDYFTLSGSLYKATSAIASGATITPGSNCEATTVTEEVGSGSGGVEFISKVYSSPSSSVKNLLNTLGVDLSTLWSTLNDNQKANMTLLEYNEAETTIGVYKLAYANLVNSSYTRFLFTRSDASGTTTATGTNIYTLIASNTTSECHKNKTILIAPSSTGSITGSLVQYDEDYALGRWVLVYPNK